jgi:MFS transporter, DHA3 family, macrolide efflux protein
VVLDLVDKSQVTDAFRVRASFGSFASIGGPILAGTLIAGAGYKQVLILAFLLVIIAFVGLVRGLPKRKVGDVERGAKGPRQFFTDWWQMTSYGARSVWVIRAERQMGLLAMITNAAMLPMVLVLIPSTVKQFLDDPAWVSGLASASLGVGVLVCSAYVMPAMKGKWSNDAQILLGRVLTSCGVTGACLALTFYLSNPNSAIATSALCVSLLASGVGLGLVNIVGSSVRSRAIPGHLRTRIFAATGFLSGVAIPLGNLMQGTLLATIGPRWAIALVAILLWVSVVVYLKSNSIRSLMRTEDSKLDGEYGRLYPQFAVEAGARGANS